MKKCDEWLSQQLMKLLQLLNMMYGYRTSLMRTDPPRCYSCDTSNTEVYESPISCPLKACVYPASMLRVTVDSLDCICVVVIMYWGNVFEVYTARKSRTAMVSKLIIDKLVYSGGDLITVKWNVEGKVTNRNQAPFCYRGDINTSHFPFVNGKCYVKFQIWLWFASGHF